MKLEAFILGLITFSFVIVVGTLFVQDLNTNYGDSGVNISTSKFNSTYNNIDSMYNVSQDMKNFTYGNELSTSNIVDSSYQGAYSAVRVMFGTFGLVSAIIYDISITLGIPSVLVVFAIVALTISVIFGLIYIILRFK